MLGDGEGGRGIHPRSVEEGRGTRGLHKWRNEILSERERLRVRLGEAWRRHCQRPPAYPRLKVEAPFEWGEPDQKTSVHTQEKVVHV